MPNAITDVPGIQVGHYTDLAGVTGCTVILCGQGAVGGVEVRGAAPGTRETDLLRPGNLVQQVHAILLTGGSAFGLDAAGGVMRYLEERGVGFETPVARVPIVPAAVLFDLSLGSSSARPDAAAGYAACLAATSGEIAQGSVGAGTGATVGKALGLSRCTKGGLGMASILLEGGVVVGALVVVNAFGEVLDPETGAILAGVRSKDGGFLRTVELLKARAVSQRPVAENTTLGVVATNARLTKAEANRLAQLAHDGLARAIRPAHTVVDGDTIFALSLGHEEHRADMLTLGAVATEVVAAATVQAVLQATGLAGIPAARELRGSENPP